MAWYRFSISSVLQFPFQPFFSSISIFFVWLTQKKHSHPFWSSLPFSFQYFFCLLFVFSFISFFFFLYSLIFLKRNLITTTKKWKNSIAFESLVLVGIGRFFVSYGCKTLQHLLFSALLHSVLSFFCSLCHFQAFYFSLSIPLCQTVYRFKKNFHLSHRNLIAYQIHTHIVQSKHTELLDGHAR